VPLGRPFSQSSASQTLSNAVPIVLTKLGSNAFPFRYGVMGMVHPIASAYIG